MILPIVAIIGRPNVGKSSLFNRFLRRNLAVVAKTPGVTRDRNYAVCDWNGVQFRLVDTGGLVVGQEDVFKKHIYDQTMFAVNEAEVVLFLVDARTGPTAVEINIARGLKKVHSKTLLVANKADGKEQETELYEFLNLGLSEPIAVSATVGRNIGDLLDSIVDRISVKEDRATIEEGTIKVALVGRPNVGKSSFINKLVGKERLIVTPVAGTTRDAVDTPFEFEGRNFVLIDTAGLRRKYKVHEDIEFYTGLRTTQAIDGCHVAVVLVDAVDGITTQDQRILEQVISSRRSLLLAVNKWDLLEKDSNTADRFTKEIKDVLAKYSFLPIIYVSALTGQRINKVLKLVIQVFDEAHKRITTSELNEFLEDIVKRKHPPAKQGKHIKLFYGTQTEVAPPTFVFFSNHPKLIDKTYISYISNQLRQRFSFEGVPFRIKFRRK